MNGLITHGFRLIVLAFLLFKVQSVSLEINQVAGFVAVRSVEEMVEPDFQQRRQRRVGRDMSADAGVFLVLGMHHGHRVPADQALDAALELAVTRVRDFFFGGNSIEVWRVQLHRNIDTGRTRTFHQRANQFGPTVRTFVVDDLVERLEPLRNFLFGVNFGLYGKLDNGIQRLVQRHGDLENLPRLTRTGTRTSRISRLKNRFCTTA